MPNGKPRFNPRFIEHLSPLDHILLTGRAATGLTALLEIQFRQQVILIPANACYIVAWAVLQSGNYPLLVDVDPKTLCIHAETIELTSQHCKDAQLPSPVAVIPIHMMGIPAPMGEISAWARQNHIHIIEDCALEPFQNQPLLPQVQAQIFSFGAGKPLDLNGGGLLRLQDGSFAQAVQNQLDTYPIATHETFQALQQWHDIYWGIHQHETDRPVLANLYPLLWEQYRTLTQFQLSAQHWQQTERKLYPSQPQIDHRRRLGEVYANAFKNRVDFPQDDIAWWKFPIFPPAHQRRGILETLWAEGENNITLWYPSLQPMMQALLPAVKQPSTPIADDLCRRVISLPVDLAMDTTDAGRIAERVIHALH